MHVLGLFNGPLKSFDLHGQNLMASLNPPQCRPLTKIGAEKSFIIDRKSVV